MRLHLVVLLAFGVLATPALGQAPARPEAPAALADDAGAARQVEAALDRRLTYDLGETDLSDLVSTLQRFVAGPFVVHPDVPLDTPVTFVADDAPLRAALSRALDATGLQLRVWSGALLVAPAGQALAAPPVDATLRGQTAALKAVFQPMPLAALLANVEGSSGRDLSVAADAQPLVDRAALLVVCDDPLPLARALTLVTHPFGLTWRLVDDVVRIERVAPLPADEDPASSRAPERDDPVAAFVARAERAIRAALEGGTDRITAEMNRLHEVVGELADRRGLIVVRHASVPEDERIKFRAREGQALGAALDAALQGARLEARVFSGALVIVPRGAALGEPPRLPVGAAGERLAAQRVTFQPMWGELPLADVLREVQEKTGVAIEVARDARAMVAKVTTDFELVDVPLPVALTLLTHAGGLTWQAEGDRIEVVRRR